MTPTTRRPAAPSFADAAVALHLARGLGYAAVCRLVAELPAWLGDAVADRPDPETLARRLGVPRDRLERAWAVMDDPRATADAGRLRRTARERGERLVTRFDDDYPPPLLDLALPPPVLYLRGTLPDFTRTRAVAVVGARKALEEGRRAAGWFAAELSAAGVAVISGLALGIDGAAHRAALAGPGPTVAVLGCGLDVVYPRRHEKLREDLVRAGGALVSEFRFGTLPRPWCFPIRNRLIAALATVTLVAQARVRSGSLVTAGHALELGREVWAVPGSIFDDRFAGNNALLRDGATPALSPRDLLETLRLPVPPVPDPAEAAPTEAMTTVPAAPADAPSGLPSRLGPLAQRLAERLAGAPADADELARELEQPVDKILLTLLDLELDGWVQRGAGCVYRLK